MIRALVDFALNNRFVVLALAILALSWGAISFHNLPVEAYPDIADNYATIITQWPGRAAEEVEQQVTIPIEIQMNGIPHLTHLRSESIFGLSFVLDIFDVSTFGGTTREYQVRVDPNKLVSYGLNIGQVEDQLAKNNINGGGNFIETGLQQMNVRTIGLFTSVKDIEQTVLTTKSGTPLRVKDIAEVAQGAKIRLGHEGRTIRRVDGTA